jgi:hypothetical protein
MTKRSTQERGEHSAHGSSRAPVAPPSQRQNVGGNPPSPDWARGMDRHDDGGQNAPVHVVHDAAESGRGVGRRVSPLAGQGESRETQRPDVAQRLDTRGGTIGPSAALASASFGDATSTV